MALAPPAGHCRLRTAVRAMMPREHLTVEEFSQLSGLSQVTVYRYVKRRRIPFAQPGGRKGRILIPATALQGLPQTAPTAPPTTEPATDQKPRRFGRKPGWKTWPEPQ